MGGRAKPANQGHAFLEFGSFRREDRPGSSGPVLFCLKSKRGERLIDAREIARAEQPDMHERRVEVVEA